MKKIFLIFVLIFNIFIYSIGFADNLEKQRSDGDGCNVSVEGIENGNIGTSLETCLGGSDLVNPGEETNVEGGFKGAINAWTARIATVLGLLAVGSIVYGSILLTLNTGEDEKIKKAKDVIKWGIIGFLGVVSASTVIALVVNIMYSLEV